MKSARLVAAAAAFLWVAAGCQMGLSYHWGLGGVTPDFLIILIGCLGLFMSRRGATTLGFLAGLAHGAVSGASLFSYVVSRVIIGFLVGWFNDLELESTPFLAMVVVAAITVVAQVVLMFMAPPGNIVAYLGATMGAAVYNGVLAMPFYALLKRILDPPR